MITREEDERSDSYAARLARADAQARACRDAQNKANALRSSGQLDRLADEHARTVLGRLRRKPCEIDPEGRL